MKCFYHSADLDGHCSGALVKWRYPECELVGINYGDPFPWDQIVPGEEVFMVDFALQPFQEMPTLAGHCRLTWIDHHISAINDYLYSVTVPPFRTIPGVLQEGRGACELTWEYFFGEADRQHEMPLAVYWLGRYDVWRHEGIEGCLAFQYGMRLYDTWPDNHTFWNDLLTNNLTVRRIAEEGKLCLEYERKMNESFCRAYAFETELDGLRCIAVNKGMTSSLVLESVYDRAKHDAMLTFAYRGGQWTVSLYSDKPEFDVSTICKARGGGGHRGAAGFQCQQLPFLAPNS